MLQIHCTGTPHQIGYAHGSLAQTQIHRTVSFYTSFFQSTARIPWSRVRELATTQFLPTIQSKWPAYLEEMRGIASGATLSLEDIIAINVRTEIAFGLYSSKQGEALNEGCTALSWKTSNGRSWLAQNWDWEEQQKENLIALTIESEDVKIPKIKMITEAGLIGKIGFNSFGVGVCLNAIRAAGLDANRVPCHLGLRIVLESRSCDEAGRRLDEWGGVASSCHMLVADSAMGGVGVEWSSMDVQVVEMNKGGQVFHTNHYLLEHDGGVVDTKWLEDSNFRVGRVEELCGKLEGKGEVTYEGLFEVFKDEENAPGSICRSQEGECKSATLFNIIMDLGEKRAWICVGKPREPKEQFVFEF